MWETITDHAARVRASMMSQHKGKQRIESLFGALGETGQALEDEIDDLITLRALAVATDAALDQCGELIGEQRLGLDDDDYRRFISARILINKTAGTTDELLAIWSLLVDSPV